MLVLLENDLCFGFKVKKVVLKTISITQIGRKKFYWTTKNPQLSR